MDIYRKKRSSGQITGLGHSLTNLRISHATLSRNNADGWPGSFARTKVKSKLKGQLLLYKKNEKRLINIQI